MKGSASPSTQIDTNVAKTAPGIVLSGVLRLLAPLVRLLIQHGVPYTTFAAALKPVFIEAARAELAANGKAQTDSALTLLCGVHRRDIREMTRAPQASAKSGQASKASAESPRALGLARQVVARWMSDATFRNRQGRPRALPRSGEDGFDALVARISSDVRPRALLDEMVRLGVAEEDGDTVRLLLSGLAPKPGMAEGATWMAENLGDHAAAAAANLRGDGKFLEQALYVDEITEASAEQLHKAAVVAWRQAFKSMATEGNQIFEADAAALPLAQRRHRVRFGVYFYSEQEVKREN